MCLLNQQKNQLEVNQAQKLNAIGNFIPGLNVTGNDDYHQNGSTARINNRRTCKI